MSGVRRAALPAATAAKRWHSTSVPVSGAGTEGQSEMKGIEQFAAEQNTLADRNPDQPGSGAQQEARRLYRELLREADKKLDPDVRDRLRGYIRGQYRVGAAVPRRQFSKIEWLLRQGRDQLNVLRRTDPLDPFNIHVPASNR